MTEYTVIDILRQSKQLQLLPRSWLRTYIYCWADHCRRHDRDVRGETSVRLYVEAVLAKAGVSPPGLAEWASWAASVATSEEVRRLSQEFHAQRVNTVLTATLIGPHSRDPQSGALADGLAEHVVDFRIADSFLRTFQSLYHSTLVQSQLDKASPVELFAHLYQMADVERSPVGQTWLRWAAVKPNPHMDMEELWQLLSKTEQLNLVSPTGEEQQQQQQQPQEEYEVTESAASAGQRASVHLLPLGDYSMDENGMQISYLTVADQGSGVQPPPPSEPDDYYQPVYRGQRIGLHGISICGESYTTAAASAMAMQASMHKAGRVPRFNNDTGKFDSDLTDPSTGKILDERERQAVAQRVMRAKATEGTLFGRAASIEADAKTAAPYWEDDPLFREAGDWVAGPVLDFITSESRTQLANIVDDPQQYARYADTVASGPSTDAQSPVLAVITAGGQQAWSEATYIQGELMAFLMEQQRRNRLPQGIIFVEPVAGSGSFTVPLTDVKEVQAVKKWNATYEADARARSELPRAFHPKPLVLLLDEKTVEYRPLLFRLALLMDAKQHASRSDFQELAAAVDPAFDNRPPKMGRPLRRDNLSSKDLELGMVELVHRLLLTHNPAFLRGGRTYPFRDPRLGLDDLADTPSVQFVVASDRRQAFNVLSQFHPIYDVRDLQTYRIWKATQADVTDEVARQRQSVEQQVRKLKSETVAPEELLEEGTVARMLRFLKAHDLLSPQHLQMDVLTKLSREDQEREKQLTSQAGQLSHLQQRVDARLRQLNQQTQNTLSQQMQALGGTYASAAKRILEMDTSQWTSVPEANEQRVERLASGPAPMEIKSDQPAAAAAAAAPATTTAGSKRTRSDEEDAEEKARARNRQRMMAESAGIVPSQVSAPMDIGQAAASAPAPAETSQEKLLRKKAEKAAKEAEAAARASATPKPMDTGNAPAKRPGGGFANTRFARPPAGAEAIIKQPTAGRRTMTRNRFVEL